jgi:hypothetical protein
MLAAIGPAQAPDASFEPRPGPCHHDDPLLVPPNFLHLDLARVKTVERAAVEQFTVLHNVPDAVGVPNESEGAAVHEYQVGHFSGLDAAEIFLHPNAFAPLMVAARSVSRGVNPPDCSAHISR